MQVHEIVGGRRTTSTSSIYNYLRYLGTLIKAEYHLKVATCSKFCTVLALRVQNVQILWVLELLASAPYWVSQETAVLNLAALNLAALNLAALNLAQNVQRFLEHYATFNLLSLTDVLKVMNSCTCAGTRFTVR